MSNKVNGYLKDFKNFNLVKAIKDQISDVADKQKKDQQKRNDEAKEAKKKLKERMAEEDREKIRENLDKLRKNQANFAKIQSRCSLKNIHDLKGNWDYLKTTQEQLEHQNEFLKQEKESRVEYLNHLKQKLLNLTLYQPKGGSQNVVPVSHTIKCVQNEESYIDPHFNDFAIEDKIAEREMLKLKIERANEILAT